MPGIFSHMRPRGRKPARRAKASGMARLLGAVLDQAAAATRQAAKVAMQPPAARSATKPAKPPGKASTGKAKAAKPRPATRGAETRPLPRGASFRSATHRCDHGERRYKIFTPARAALSPTALPLLVMLHGCGQTPDDFARGTRMNVLADELGFLVLYPAQPREAHPNRCWNWFRRADQGRDAGEPGLIASLTRHVIQAHGADPARVYVAGLSAGASAALVLADTYPDLFAAVGVHSGLTVGAARDHASALIAMQRGNPGARRAAAVPTIAFHGSADRVVNPRNGRLVAIRAVEPFPSLRRTETQGRVVNGREWIKTVHRIGKGRPYVEHWSIKAAGHAWSGGSPAGRFTDPAGPDASREMLRFFLRHRLRPRRRPAGA